MINVIIPARSGSKRVKNKNIKLVGEHPLIAYSIEACRQSENVGRIFVSTDCKEIASVAIRYGAEVPWLRPKELSSDSSSDVGFLNHFFENVDCNVVALIRPTSPLRDPKFIDETIDEFFSLDDDSITGLRTMSISGHSPYKLFKIENNLCTGFFNDFNGVSEYSNLPGQIFPKTYLPNGYIDIIKKSTLLKGSAFGNKIYPKISDQIIDIDTEFDFDLVILKIKSKYDKITRHLKNSAKGNINE